MAVACEQSRPAAMPSDAPREERGGIVFWNPAAENLLA
jgi:hypothetical protein